VGDWVGTEALDSESLLQAAVSISTTIPAAIANRLRILKLLRIDTQVPKDGAQRAGRKVSAPPVRNRGSSERRRINPDFVVTTSLTVELTTQASKLPR
jgi:hypothetical protein